MQELSALPKLKLKRNPTKMNTFLRKKRWMKDLIADEIKSSVLGSSITTSSSRMGLL